MKDNQPHNSLFNHKLIIHFDIENIIKLPDLKDKELYIYQKCSEWSWGKLEVHEKQKGNQRSQWKPIVNSLSEERPESDLINYKQYLDEYLKPSNEQRQKLLMNFTKGVGVNHKGQIQKKLKNITVPKALLEYIKQSNNNGFLIERYLKQSKYLILPAFYKVLLHLKKNKREFSIILHQRNSSADHKHIIAELNLFFTGQHPLYNGKNGTPLVKMDGTKGCKNFVITESQHYAITFFGESDYFSVYGTYDQGPKEPDRQIFIQRYKNKKNRNICQGWSDIYAYSHTLLSQSACQYGVDQNGVITVDLADVLTQQIYFTQKDQVQIYSCLGQKLNSSNIVIKVSLLELLNDIDYFIKKVEKAQTDKAFELSKQKGISKIQGQQNAIQVENVSNSQFLKLNILPVLEGALRQVDLLRPENPIAFIALYCLKHKQRVQNL